MDFYMFVHRLSPDGMRSAEMTGALKYAKGSITISGTKKLIDKYKRVLTTDAWSRAERSEGNPFSAIFGASMIPRYVFSEGNEGATMYGDFLKSSSSLRTEMVKR
jgi:hypothetical protein